MLYKYLPLVRLSYLSDQLLRAIQPGFLNDPFECISIPPSIDEAISLCKKSHKEFIRNHSQMIDNQQIDQKLNHNEILKSEISKLTNKQRPNYLDYLIENQKKRINTLFGIISFSNRWNSSLMWAHYCDSHQGFCIGFDESHPFFYTDINSFITGNKITIKVEYSNQRIKIPVEPDSASFIKNAWRILGLKSNDWKYEKEVRTITLLSDFSEKISNSPFDIYLFSVPHDAVKEIIIGINTPIKTINTIQNFATKKNIKLYRIERSKTKFTFERELLIT